MNVKKTLRSRQTRLVALSLGVGFLFYGLLGIATEKWRVFNSDMLPAVSLDLILGFGRLGALLRIAAWVLSSAAFLYLVAWIARHHRSGWLLLILYIPAFWIARATVIDARYRDSIASCGNHSGFWWGLEDSFLSKPLPLKFTDLVIAFHGPDFPLRGARCPGYRLAGTETGVVYVGGGLALDQIRDHYILLAFCSHLSHPPPHDHQHYLYWDGEVEVGGELYPSFRRSCSNTHVMIAFIERALDQAASGKVPYSEEAQALLRSELAHRQALARTMDMDTNLPPRRDWRYPWNADDESWQLEP